MPRRLISLLDEDPELGEKLDPKDLPTAGERVLAEAIDVTSELPASWPASLRDGLGVLVLDGLLLRRVGLDGRFGAELLGRGDLLRPWQNEETASSIPHTAGWRVLRRGRIALLDIDFARRIVAYPSVQGQLMARATSWP